MGAAKATQQRGGSVYRRVLMLNGKSCEVAVTQIAAPNSPRVPVAIIGARLTSDVKTVTTSSLERLLGHWDRRRTRCEPGPARERFRGLKPPRFPTLFEALANGIACQQMSLTLGILLNRLAEKLGVAVRSTSGLVQCLPAPRRSWRTCKLGFSRQKGRYLIELSRTFLDGHSTRKRCRILATKQR